jgi:CheY-like chemotaxis protein
MTEEVKSRIFDPFFTTKEEGRGIGLGLASVYGIVNHSGGCIQVFSEPDKGTTFRLYFPAAEEDENTSKWNNSDQIMSEGQEKVLIVEEHSAVRSVAVRTLKRLGYKTFEAKSGSDALTLCEKMKEMVDLVIVDVIIPHINGVELVERLKVFFPQLKSLYISGYEPGSIVETGILPENAPYLKKPFRPIDLAQKVREVLDN